MDVVDLILYCMQQLGVMLGVGAETIMLFAYLHAIGDGVVDEQEQGFAGAIRRILFAGIIFIIISGAVITMLELAAGHQAIVFSPGYIFKWCLIGLVTFFFFSVRGSSLPAGLSEGLVGATWYALFIVHILAPITTWGQALALYGVWLVVFLLVWVSSVFFFRGSIDPSMAPIPPPRPPAQPLQARGPATAPTPRVSAPPRPAAPVYSQPRSVPIPNPAHSGPYVPPRQPIIQTPPFARGFTSPNNPAPATARPMVRTAPAQMNDIPNLPTILVMPKNPEDAARQG